MRFLDLFFGGVRSGGLRPSSRSARSLSQSGPNSAVTTAMANSATSVISTRSMGFIAFYPHYI
jgi:hypothetical protein